MTEQEDREILSPEWKKAIAEGIQSALDNYELFDRRIDVAPLNISGGMDGRGFPGLSPEEQQFVRSVLYKEVGFDPRDITLLDVYTIGAPRGAEWEGEASVGVYITSRSESENMFLHKIDFPDGKVDFVVAPQNFRL